MTSLGGSVVWQNAEYVGYRHVSGDLSYSIWVMSKRAYAGIRSGQGVSVADYIQVRRVADIPLVLTDVRKYGWSKAQDIWSAKARSGDYSFGYLKGATAKKYSKEKGAYGDYAKKYWGV